MKEHLAPVLRVADANASVDWYGRLGFIKQWEHRFAPDLPEIAHKDWGREFELTDLDGNRVRVGTPWDR